MVVCGALGRWSIIYMGHYLQQESPPPPGVPIGRQARVERVQTARMITMVMILVMFGDISDTRHVHFPMARSTLGGGV